MAQIRKPRPKKATSNARRPARPVGTKPVRTARSRVMARRRDPAQPTGPCGAGTVSINGVCVTADQAFSNMQHVKPGGGAISNYSEVQDMLSSKTKFDGKDDTKVNNGTHNLKLLEAFFADKDGTTAVRSVCNKVAKAESIYLPYNLLWARPKLV